jgi:hypothetical protein
MIMLWYMLKCVMNPSVSLISGRPAAMALETSRVVDISALIASPIIGAGHVSPASALNSGWRGDGIGFGLITSLTPIAEVKIQKSAFDAIPFSVELEGLVAGGAVAGPRARSIPLLFHLLLLSPAISVHHDRLQVAQLRLYYPRNSLHYVHLRHWPLRPWLEGLGLNGRFWLRGIGLMVHGTHFVMREAHLRGHYHGGFGL